MSFTLAPRVLKPTSVCIPKAKSNGVAPLGKDFKSPLGEKTNISLEYKLSLNCSTKSTASASLLSKASC